MLGMGLCGHGNIVNMAKIYIANTEDWSQEALELRRRDSIELKRQLLNLFTVDNSLNRLS